MCCIFYHNFIYYLHFFVQWHVSKPKKIIFKKIFKRLFLLFCSIRCFVRLCSRCTEPFGTRQMRRLWSLLHYLQQRQEGEYEHYFILRVFIRAQSSDQALVSWMGVARLVSPNMNFFTFRVRVKWSLWNLSLSIFSWGIGNSKSKIFQYLGRGVKNLILEIWGDLLYPLENGKLSFT